MKHITLILFAALSIMLNPTASAKFAMIAPGVLVDSVDNSKEFTVANFGTFSQEEAIPKIEQILNAKFCENYDKLTTNGNVITIEGHKLNKIGEKSLGIQIPGYYHIIYKIVVTIRDGRAKIEIPVCKLARSNIMKPNTENELLNGKNISEKYMYNGKEELKSKYTAETLLAFLNNFVSLIENVEKEINASNDDW